jgi:hypothetical protein
MLVQRALDYLRNLFSAKNADDVIDLGNLFEQVFSLSFRQAASDDDRSDPAFLLQGQHLAYDSQGLLPGRFDEAAGIHDHHVGAIRLGGKDVPILRKAAQHALGINEILWTT